jgi:hypothetical protein
MVVTHNNNTQEKWQTNYIWINFNKLTIVTKKDPYPLPFLDEVVNTIAGSKAYFFLDGYSRYHQI